MNNNKAEEVRTTGCTLMIFEDREYRRVVTKDFQTEADIVILIHGFTSHGEYMGEELAPYLRHENYQVFLFNYDSYRGILPAVNSLRELLESYNNQTDRKISSKKIFLIGHSMGGLVARKFTIDDAKQKYSDRLIRGVVMLATPNNGVLQNRLSDQQWRKFTNHLIFVSEEIGGVFPQARTLGCKAVRELTKIDENNIVTTLNNEWKQMENDLPPSLSISGGLNYLRFSKNQLREQIINRAIQRFICDDNTELPNDGIVLESSVDLNSYINSLSGEYTHINNYFEYRNTNHNTIHLQQIVSTRIQEWLQTIHQSAIFIIINTNNNSEITVEIMFGHDYTIGLG